MKEQDTGSLTKRERKKNRLAGPALLLLLLASAAVSASVIYGIVKVVAKYFSP